MRLPRSSGQGSADALRALLRTLADDAENTRTPSYGASPPRQESRGNHHRKQKKRHRRRLGFWTGFQDSQDGLGFLEGGKFGGNLGDGEIRDSETSIRHSSIPGAGYLWSPDSTTMAFYRDMLTLPMTLAMTLLTLTADRGSGHVEFRKPLIQSMLRQ